MGQPITELRKLKGLSQEDMVNLSSAFSRQVYSCRCGQKHRYLNMNSA